MRPYLLALAVALVYLVIRQRAAVRVDLRLVVTLISLAAIAAFLRRLPWAGNRRTPLWLALALPCYAAFQLLPLPASLLALLSPERARLLEQLRAFGAGWDSAPLTAVPAAAFGYWLLVSGCTLLFVLVWRISGAAGRDRAWEPAYPLIAVAMGEACLGIAQSLKGVTVSGTYANKNHYAGLLEMVLPLAAAYGASRIAAAVSGREAPASTWVKGMAGILAAALCFAGLLVGLSKAGLISAFFGLFALGAIAAWSAFTGWRRWAAVACVLLVCLLGFVFFPPDQLLKAFGQAFGKDFESLEGRRPVWSDTVHLIRDYAATGVGLGGYGSVFPRYQTAVVEAEFTYAHNDYLQVMAELGIAGTLIVFLLGAAVLWHGWKAARSADPEIRYPALGCLGGIAAIAMHSSADFNLYIPPNSMVLAWMTGLLAGLPVRQTSKAGDAVWLRRVVAGVAAVAAVASVWTLAAPPKTVALSKEELRAAAPARVLEMVREDAAATANWTGLGESYLRTQESAKARQSFAIAEQTGPYVPSTLIRGAMGAYALGDRQEALRRMAKIMEKSGAYDTTIFHWYRMKKIPVEEVLAEGIPTGARAAQSFCRYLTAYGTVEDAGVVWERLASKGWLDEPVARDYSRFLHKNQEFAGAAKALSQFLGPERGFHESTWVLNGGFEERPMGTEFDWRVDPVPGAKISLDTGAAHGGRNSVRIRFDGSQNVEFQNVRQMVYLPAGSYRLSAWVKTEGITTDEGVGLEIVANDARAPLKAASDRVVGSSGWKKVETSFTVPAGGRLAALLVTRHRSLRFVNQIDGTAWVDDVEIARRSSPQ